MHTSVLDIKTSLNQNEGVNKYVLGLFVLLVTLLPSSALAAHRFYNRPDYRHHHENPIPKPPLSNPGPPTPQPPAPTNPPPTLSPSPSSNICINYGYGGSQDNPSADLANLKSHGINCVRLAFNGQNSSQTEALALQAKNLGFYVEIGNDGDPTASSYSSGVVAEATWAQSNHIDQMSIGNETTKNVQTQQALSILSCQVRNVYAGIISYDTYLDPNGFDDIKAWAGNIGCLDKLGLNTYANYQNTYQEANTLLGVGHWYISEFNLDCDTGACNSDSSWASGLQSVWNIAMVWNVKTNFFAYRCNGSACPTHWTIIGHPQVQAVLGL